METACLRIKFNPLIQQNTISNSNCCLEIVPEVLCVENLDKLIWKQETNLIEFTIPMTHKVVLQKRRVKKYESDNVKTYHSCVDLLLTSSNSIFESRGSGDVVKVISDTLIPTKCCLENCTSKEHFILTLMDGREHHDNYVLQPVSRAMTSTLLKPADIEKKETETNTMDDEVQATINEPTKKQNVDLYNESFDKITNTESRYLGFSSTLQSENVVMDTITAKRAVKHEPARLLSLSPICSVNARGTPPVNKFVASKAVTCEICETQRDIVLLSPASCYGSNSSPSDLFNESRALSTMMDISRQNFPNKISLKCKTSQQMRVVEYVRYMEKEILPLKLWLNDIIRKCSELGIQITKQTSEQSMTIKTISTSSAPEMKISEKSTKSNRVVYSIVYDE